VSATRRLPVPEGYDFGATVGALPMSHHDPCLRIAHGAFWWATRTPDGLATLSLRKESGSLVATGYGPGAEWVLDRADAVAGLRDDPSGFAEVAARHPVVAELARRHAGMRLAATGRVFQRLLRAVFEQKVTGKEAYRAYAATVRHFHAATGREPAPGPLLGLLPPPDPSAVAATPYWVFHPFGVEQRPGRHACAGRPRRRTGWRSAPTRRGHEAADRRSPASAPGPRPKWSAWSTATPTPSRSATTTSRTWSPGRWPARPGPARVTPARTVG
jgi:hypothetical protein